jgi:Cu(I)/Ag(I) efflux system membrane fusion protein
MFVKQLKVILPVLLAGLLIGYWARGGGAGPELAGSAGNAPAASEGRTAESIYVCPMMCVPPRDNPGDCPICGMELIATAAGEKSARPRLKLAAETVRLARIRTAPVERRPVAAEVRLFGQIEYDPVHISYASAYVPGVIDRIYVKRAGQTVRWGDPLFDIRSPEILMIQEQLVAALKQVSGFFSMDQSKPHVRKRTEVLLDRPADLRNPTPEQKKALEAIKAMRLKLTLIGMEKVDIDELMKKGEPSGIATIYAQRNGLVIEQKAFAGTYVNTGTPVFAIASPKFVWARLAAYEADYAWIRIGQAVRFVTDAFPGETFTGKVAAIDPVFDPKSRTFGVGVVFQDSGRRFRPSMYVRAVIEARMTARGHVAGEEADSGKAPLVIPAAAPLITGKRAVVYVALPGEEVVYEGREVVLGPRAREHYIVLEGLQEGDQVVVNGNFKIDSQVQIMAKASMMSIEGGAPADDHQRHVGSGSVEPENRRRAPPGWAAPDGPPAMPAAPADEMETGGMPMGRGHRHP